MPRPYEGRGPNNNHQRKALAAVVDADERLEQVRYLRRELSVELIYSEEVKLHIG